MSAIMETFEATFSHLKADDAAKASLNDMVGKEVRYVIPTNKQSKAQLVRAHGTVILDNTFTIVGIQRDFNGDVVFRAKCNGFNDTFGRCLDPKLIVIVE